MWFSCEKFTICSVNTAESIQSLTLHFPVLGLSTETYEINLCIQSKYGKIRTRKNSAFGHFSRSGRTFQEFIRTALAIALLLYSNMGSMLLIGLLLQTDTLSIAKYSIFLLCSIFLWSK